MKTHSLGKKKVVKMADQVSNKQKKDTTFLSPGHELVQIGMVDAAVGAEIKC